MKRLCCDGMTARLPPLPAGMNEAAASIQWKAGLKHCWCLQKKVLRCRYGQSQSKSVIIIRITIFVDISYAMRVFFYVWFILFLFCFSLGIMNWNPSLLVLTKPKCKSTSTVPGRVDRRAWWSQCQLPFCEGRVTPWTGCQFITQPRRQTNKQPFTVTFAHRRTI